MRKEIRKYILLVQGIYVFITAAWPLVNLDSFFAVTGPKTDIWLVKTAASILGVIGASFLLAFITKQLSAAIQFLAIGLAAVLLIIDFTYVYKGVISTIYMLDALINVVFLLAWILSLIQIRRAAE